MEEKKLDERKGFEIRIGEPVSDELPKGQPVYKVYNADTGVLEHECRVLYYAYSFIFHASEQMNQVNKELEGGQSVAVPEAGQVYEH